jgi:hypothetical protein
MHLDQPVYNFCADSNIEARLLFQERNFSDGAAFLRFQVLEPGSRPRVVRRVADAAFPRRTSEFLDKPLGIDGGTLARATCPGATSGTEDAVELAIMHATLVFDVPGVHRCSTFGARPTVGPRIVDASRPGD